MPPRPEPSKARRDRTELATLVHLWPYMWPKDRTDLKWRVVIAILALIIAKIITVLVPYTYKWATDALVRDTDHPELIVAATVPVLLVISYGIGRILLTAFNQLRDALFARVGQHAVRTLGNEVFRHLHGLSLRFHLQRRTGGLSRVIERGTNGIESIVRYSILNSLPTALEFALTAAVIWWQFDVWYLAIIAITVWLYLWFTVKMSNWRIGIVRTMNTSDTDANSKAIDALLNYETVKYFNNETVEQVRFDKSRAIYEAAAVRTWTSLAWLNQGQMVIVTIGMVACMARSAYAVVHGQQSIGDFVLLNALLMQLSVPLNFIGFIYREIRQGLTDVEAMFELLDVPPEVQDKPDAKPLAIARGSITFEDVKFNYDPDREILKGISFTVPAGKTVALVGPSGAGKSTISRLIFRFYDVTGGRILIDGQDIRDVTQASLRAAIGIVPQDTVLFNDTIAYNIRYGRLSATPAEVAEAAASAQIAGFIAGLPQGYDTEVGERGLKLSGGEKQRVAIARTILKAPPILILDEATSALDTRTEQEIQSAIDRVAKDRTTLVIAHRLSTLVDADEILVLEAGAVVERGTHASLIARGGLYAEMWERQRAAAEAEAVAKAAETGTGRPLEVAPV